jgi:hypothetical protein
MHMHNALYDSENLKDSKDRGERWCVSRNLRDHDHLTLEEEMSCNAMMARKFRFGSVVEIWLT